MTQFTVEVIYCQQAPQCPPDIVFPDEDEPFLKLHQIISLVKWVPENPNALLDVLLEILELYKSQQCRLISSFPNDKIRTEYVTFIESQEGAEVCVQSSVESTRIFCTIPIPVSITGVVDRGRMLDGSGVVTLFLKYTLSNTMGHVTPEVSWILPPQLEALYMDKPPKIPVLNAQTLLVEYVPQVVTALTSPLESLTSRKQLFLAFHVLGSPLEWDNSYTKFSWMFYDERQEFGTVVIINIPENFPTEKPILTLVSLTTFYANKPLSRAFRDYPYSPRWPATELANRILTFLRESAHDVKTGWANEVKQMR